MSLLLLALAVLVAGGGLALLFGNRPNVATRLGVLSVVVGSALGLTAALQGLLFNQPPVLHWPWNVPYGEFHLAIDPLSAVFLLVIFGLSLLSAVYGGPYMRAYQHEKSLGAPWFFFNLLVASMALLVVARNGILFLTAWEVMAIASFFLVTFEHERPEVQKAGWTYLVAAHLGTAFLLAMFAVLARETGSMDFDAFASMKHLAPATASMLFLFAIVGFGAKAGFVPFHVWLPEAPPAAPSHVSALMSGVMIKTGIYGILRVLTFLGPPPIWWGALLVSIGVFSGVLGVMYALAQHDLKRLLAYHSVENIGIITMGLGVGVLGLSLGSTTMAVLGFTGAVLHTMNHAIFKGLLFLGAGTVLQATGEREMDKLGGLLKRMPVSGGTFLVGAASISGLPPLNGFVSEFLILLGALQGALLSNMAIVPLSLVVIVGLALIGGLASACFAKAFGITYLGFPRTKKAAQAHEVTWGFWAPMLALAAFCLIIGLAAPLAVRLVLPVSSQMAGVSLDSARAALTPAVAPLGNITMVALIVVGLVVCLWLLRQFLLSSRQVGTAGTWDCGYEAPSARMQYTSSSFAQPLLDVFYPVVRPRKSLHPVEGYFPQKASFHSEVRDLFTDHLYRPVLALFEWSSFRLRWLQQGRVHLYLLYILITLVVLLVWRLRL